MNGCSSIVLLLFLFALVGCGEPSGTGGNTPPAVVDDPVAAGISEERAIMLAAVAHVGQFNPMREESYVLRTPTIAHAELTGYIAEFDEWGGSELPAEVRPAITDMLRKNAKSVDINSGLGSGSQYRILTEQELDAIDWAGNGGPARFRAKYPGAMEFIDLSRPGLSPDGNRAAIYIAWHRDHLVAEASLLILERKSGQ